uniref:lymphotoxin-alpha n=1 Tax=Semicossyphus pulcher TaxID=241346 RepID=UPI0037E7B946
MEAQPRSSHKYVVLQVWCGLLTVAMVVMAALFTTIKPKPTEDEVYLQKSDYVTPRADTPMSPSSLKGSSLAYIQLIKSPDKHSWNEEHSCKSCSLTLRDDSIQCSGSGFYFLYAQVTISRQHRNNQNISVILKRNSSFGKIMKVLVEGTFPHLTEGSVWVAKIVRLSEGDSVSLDITADVLKDHTFWGAFQLH